MSNTKIAKVYPIDQCALYRCGSKRRLEKLINLKPGSLNQTLADISYHSFQQPKKKPGEMRTISAPDRKVKTVQSRVLRLLRSVERPEWLISTKRKKCYIDNGKAHVHSSYVLTADISKFYDNCQREPVYQFFLKKLLTAPDVAAALTDIVTYKSGIPTGCPTSQIIAYYAYEDMFFRIFQAARRYGCVFTLYVDDMTFSSQSPFEPKALTREVDRILRKYGHKVKRSKVHYYGARTNKMITGTVVTADNRLDIPNSLQKKIYDGFQEIKNVTTYGEVNEQNYKKVQSLSGRILAARAIDQYRFPEISRLTQEKRSALEKQI